MTQGFNTRVRVTSFVRMTTSIKAFNVLLYWKMGDDKALLQILEISFNFP